MTAGGRQEAEFIDGLRFSYVATKNMRMNVDIRNGIAPASLPPGTQSLNSFAWVVNTTDPTASISASMRIPVNMNMLLAMTPQGALPSAMLAAAKRPLNSQGPFTVTGDVSRQVVDELGQTTVVVRDMQQLDGEYVLLVTPPAAVPNLPKSDREAKGYRRRRM